MPIVLIIFGAIFVDLGMRGTEHEFAEQLGEDLAGTHFWAWIAAMTIFGAVGYYEPARKVSDMIVTLILLTLAISQRGLLQAFASLISNPPAASPAVPLPNIFSSGGASSDQASTGAGGAQSTSNPISSATGFATSLLTGDPTDAVSGILGAIGI